MVYYHMHSVAILAQDIWFRCRTVVPHAQHVSLMREGVLSGGITAASVGLLNYAAQLYHGLRESCDQCAHQQAVTHQSSVDIVVVLLLAIIFAAVIIRLFVSSPKRHNCHRCRFVAETHSSASRDTTAPSLSSLAHAGGDSNSDTADTRSVDHSDSDSTSPRKKFRGQL